jgi:hypothetical protein
VRLCGRPRARRRPGLATEVDLAHRPDALAEAIVDQGAFTHLIEDRAHAPHGRKRGAGASTAQGLRAQRQTQYRNRPIIVKAMVATSMALLTREVRASNP